MADKIYNVLFICTGNSARSILAEAIINQLGAGRFKGYSAGSLPRGEVNPRAIALLKTLGIPTDDARSKSWDEFTGPDAPALDFIITVCDNAADEVCPVWPGESVTAHWGLPDPAAVTGTEAETSLAFSDAFRVLRNRISLFLNLQIRSLDRLSLQARLTAIGNTTG
ncbi:arsenate reductase ArsC [Asticcacaulis sp.]|uniref:arsenate reductase ArsC n=1 Tax=Asticcacaulis sp. TaxID=1872648 RepID=UPI003919DC00